MKEYLSSKAIEFNVIGQRTFKQKSNPPYPEMSYRRQLIDVKALMKRKQFEDASITPLLEHVALCRS